MNPLLIMALIFGPFLLLCGLIMYFGIPDDDPIYPEPDEPPEEFGKLAKAIGAGFIAIVLFVALILGGPVGLLAAVLVLGVLILGLAIVRTIAHSAHHAIRQRKRRRENLAPLPARPPLLRRFGKNIEWSVVALPAVFLSGLQ